MNVLIVVKDYEPDDYNQVVLDIKYLADDYFHRECAVFADQGDDYDDKDKRWNWR